MPSIIVPSRRLIQPQGYAQPAGESWLTYLPSASINALIDGRVLSNVGVSELVGGSGVSANIDAAGDYLQYTPSSNKPSAFHLVSVFDLNASSTFSRLFECESLLGDPRFAIWFAPSTSSGANGNASSVVIVRNVTGGTGSGERWSTPANSLVRPRSGVVLEVLWSATSSDTSAPQVWINGVSQTMTKVQSSIPSSTSFASLSGVALRIGNRFGAIDRGMLGKVYLLHIEQQARVTPYINPWQLFRASPRRLYLDVSAGGGSVSLVIADATHGHTADALVLTSSTGLAIDDALHAHAADNVTLTTSGAVSLVVQNATHAHTADGITLTTLSVLAVDDATHGHTADNLTLTVSFGSITLVIQDATHAQIADALTLTADSFLAVADALHGHTADNITFAETLSAAYVRALLSIGSTGGTVTLQHRSATSGTNSTLKQDLFYLKRRTIN